VLKIIHDSAYLQDFTNDCTTILWEPSQSVNPIYYELIQAHIIATVSPNIIRYKEFQKNGAICFFLPCPSKTQLRLMGQVLRSITLHLYPSDVVICNRVRDYGPFIRIVLSIQSSVVEEFETNRTADVQKITESSKRFLETLSATIHIIPDEQGRLRGLSHRLAQYVVNRNENFAFFGFGKALYTISSPAVTKLFNDYTSQLSIEELQSYLFALNNGQQFPYNNNKALEHLFLKLSTTKHGINWQSFQMKQKGTYQQFEVHFHSCVRNKISFNQMQTEVLYYPQDCNFPLVDFYYLNNQGHLVAIQATTAKSHEKAVSTYQTFYRLLGIPNETHLSLYYLILPCNTNKYVKDEYTDSIFFKNVKTNIDLIKEWKTRVSFHALIPSNDFKYNFSSEM
jgi:hypothetical protein